MVLFKFVCDMMFRPLITGVVRLLKPVYIVIIEALSRDDVETAVLRNVVESA
jgi:hypothetical protein